MDVGPEHRHSEVSEFRKRNTPVSSGTKKQTGNPCLKDPLIKCRTSSHPCREVQVRNLDETPLHKMYFFFGNFVLLDTRTSVTLRDTHSWDTIIVSRERTTDPLYSEIVISIIIILLVKVVFPSN